MRMIRIYPMREVVPEHPTAGRIKAGGLGTMWPADQFTFRRIADGDISKEDPNLSVSAAAPQLSRTRTRRSDH